MLSKQGKTALCFHKEEPPKEIKHKDGTVTLIGKATRSELKKILLSAEKHYHHVKHRKTRFKQDDAAA
jgi:hypothetical protein